jgi:hypothetical protein
MFLRVCSSSPWLTYVSRLQLTPVRLLCFQSTRNLTVHCLLYVRSRNCSKCKRSRSNVIPGTYQPHSNSTQNVGAHKPIAKNYCFYTNWTPRTIRAYSNAQVFARTQGTRLKRRVLFEEVHLWQFCNNRPCTLWVWRGPSVSFAYWPNNPSTPP